VKSSCEFNNAPPCSITCWETIDDYTTGDLSSCAQFLGVSLVTGYLISH
jgi:hypothetical protein